MGVLQPSVSIEYHIAEVRSGHHKRWEHTGEATVNCLEHGVLADHVPAVTADRVYRDHIEEHQQRGEGKRWVVDGVTKGTIRHLLDEHHVRPHHVWGAFEDQHRHLHARKGNHDHPELAEALERAREMMEP